MEFTRISDKEISTEARIIDQAKRDPQHFEVLYRRYHLEIYRYVFHKVRDQEVAGDIASQVFVKALGQLKKYKHKGVPFSAWLFRIAINEVNQYFRKTQKTRFLSIESSGLEELQETLEDTSEKELLLNVMKEVLVGLSDAEVTLIDLRFFEGRSFKEVGQIMEISEANAKAKTYRILKRMRSRMVEKMQHEQKIGNRH